PALAHDGGRHQIRPPADSGNAPKLYRAPNRDDWIASQLLPWGRVLCGRCVMAQVCVLPKVEQRREPRYALPRRTLCRLKRATETVSWIAILRNISAEGIGLILNRRVKAGMLLTVELPGTNGKPGALKAIKVTHAAAQSGSPWWVAGGRFASPLTSADLRSLL